MINTLSSLFPLSSHLFPPRSHLLAPRSHLLALLLALLAATTAEAAVPSKLSYRGVLSWKNAGGLDVPRSGAESITFRLYDRNSVSNGEMKVVWARALSVAVDSNGVFYTELNDAEGINRLPGSPSLADALASCDGKVELGLQPEGMGELRPRQQFSLYVRATRAARAGSADYAYTPGGLLAPGLSADEVTTGGVLVPPGGHVAVPGACRFSSMPARIVGGYEKTSLVLEQVRTLRPSLPYDRGCFLNYDLSSTNLTDTALSDLLITYENEQGAYNAIVPRGGRVVWGNADDALVTNVQTMAISAFGDIRRD